MAKLFSNHSVRKKLMLILFIVALGIPSLLVARSYANSQTHSGTSNPSHARIGTDPTIGALLEANSTSIPPMVEPVEDSLQGR
jgi:hypothetical protein